MQKKYSSNKEVNNVVQLAISLGWKVEKKRSSHIALYSPNTNSGVVIIPCTPSNARGWKNALSLLRKQGLPV